MDFVICENGDPVRLIECKHTDKRPAPSLQRFAVAFPEAEAIQLVRVLRQEEYHKPVMVLKAADWLAELAA